MYLGGQTASTGARDKGQNGGECRRTSIESGCGASTSKGTIDVYVCVVFVYLIYIYRERTMLSSVFMNFPSFLPFAYSVPPNSDTCVVSSSPES